MVAQPIITGKRSQAKRHAAAAFALCIAPLLFFPCRPAAGADTVETWDIGATDVDFYVGFDGIGLEKYEKSVYGDIMLGYGLIDRFSAYVGAALQGNEFFADGEACIYLGIFGTPVETKHFDFDLFLDFAAGGKGMRDFQVAPALEINFDIDPDMRSWGLYLRTAFPVGGSEASAPGGESSVDYDTVFHIEPVIGMYCTIAEKHQILLELDLAVHPLAGGDERTAEVGGFALGYNVTLCDAIEMINEVYVDIPQGREKPSLNIMTGLIATMPSVKKR